MGEIADRIRQMRGRSFDEVVAEIERMESQALDVGADDFGTLWASYPHKTAKKAAEKAYRAARKKGISYTTIFDGVARYVREKPADRPWMHLATFLNGERWNDQEAPVGRQMSNLDLLEQDLAGRINNGYGSQGGSYPQAVPRLSRG